MEKHHDTYIHGCEPENQNAINIHDMGVNHRESQCYIYHMTSVWLCEVNKYMVRSYRDVIVVANIVTRRTSKA